MRTVPEEVAWDRAFREARVLVAESTAGDEQRDGDGDCQVDRQGVGEALVEGVGLDNRLRPLFLGRTT